MLCLLLLRLQVLRIGLVCAHHVVPEYEVPAEVAHVVGVMVVVRGRAVHGRNDGERRHGERPVIAGVRVDGLPELKVQVHPRHAEVGAHEERAGGGREDVGEEVLDRVAVLRRDPDGVFERVVLLFAKRVLEARVVRSACC